jgi:hypothetical protein
LVSNQNFGVKFEGIRYRIFWRFVRKIQIQLDILLQAAKMAPTIPRTSDIFSQPPFKGLAAENWQGKRHCRSDELIGERSKIQIALNHVEKGDCNDSGP